MKTAWTSDLQNRETINEWCFNLQIYDNLLRNNRNKCGPKLNLFFVKDYRPAASWTHV